MLIRSRWAAIGAAVAVTMGGGGLSMVAATSDSDVKPVVVTIAPERVLDTRDDLGLTGPFVSETPRELTVTGPVAVASSGTKTVVPAGASAVLVNVTVVTPTDLGFLSLRPGGSTGKPSTSTVNFIAGTVEPNGATVDLGLGGRVQIYVKTASPSGSAHVLLDIVGYTIDHGHDDRYYTESEVDAMIAAIPEGPPGSLGTATVPAITFTPAAWTISGVGPGVHDIWMVADVSPLTADEVEVLGGRLVWEEVEIDLCAVPDFTGSFDGIGIRSFGDGFLQIGDGFQTDGQYTGCPINDAMQSAFDLYGPPLTACLSVDATAGDVGIEYCAPLEVLP